MNSPGRPVGNFLFLGPTGTGKTRLVEALAESLVGNARAVLKVDCAEFQHSHEIAKLIGSPPGYLGHRETHPFYPGSAQPVPYGQDETQLHPVRRNRKGQRSLVEPAPWRSRQSHADSGRQPPRGPLAGMIFMTSNLGAGEMTHLVKVGFGFVPPRFRSYDQGLDDKIDRTAHRSRAPQVHPRVHEPYRQGGGSSTPCATNT